MESGSRDLRRAALLLMAGLLLGGLAGAFALGRFGPSPTPAAEPQAQAPAVAAATPAALPAETAPGEAAEPLDPAVAAIPLTQLPLRLVATVVGKGRGGLSVAAIEDQEHGGHQVLAEGEVLEQRPAVTLSRVASDHVLLDNAGVQERLQIDRSPTASAEAAADAASVPLELSAEERERRRELSQRLRELTDAGEDWRRQEHRGGILAEGDVAPLYEDGALVGVEVSGIKKGGVYDKVGLREGDVVTSVNGVSLGEPTAAGQLVRELATSDDITVAVERGDGTVELLTLPTGELTAHLEGLELE